MCPKCGKDNSELLYDFGYGLSLHCLNCDNYYEIVEINEV